MNQDVNMVAHDHPGVEFVVAQYLVGIQERIGYGVGDLRASQVMLILNAAMQPPRDKQRFVPRVPVRQMAAIESHEEEWRRGPVSLAKFRLNLPRAPISMQS